MRNLSDLPLEFTLKGPRIGSLISTGPGHYGNVKSRIGATWRQSTRGRGGWWAATADWEGTEMEKEDLFLEGMLSEISVKMGSLPVWEGFLAKMILTRPDGEIYIRDWSQVYNKWKTIYTRVGDNQFSNGSAESGAWTQIGTPTAVTQSTSWVTDGDYSCYIETNEADEGALIETGISITAGKNYQISCNIYISLGDWFLEVYRTDTGEVIASAAEGEPGEFVLSTSISDKNTYTGTIGVRLVCDDSGGGICYGDGAVFCDAPYRSETKWYQDEPSISEFGIKEEIILLGGSSDESAASKAQRGLKLSAWARSLPPDTYSGDLGDGLETRLELFFLGYVWTLNNTFSLTKGTNDASDHISALATEAQFITPGIVEDNTQSYQIETTSPARIWDIIEDITLDGDGAGALWECGVYSNRMLDYKAVEEAVKYQWQNKTLYSGRSIIDPWLARPGYVKLLNMPLGSEGISSYETNDPRVVYMFEVEFNAAEWLAGKSGLNWIRDNYSD